MIGRAFNGTNGGKTAQLHSKSTHQTLPLADRSDRTRAHNRSHAISISICVAKWQPNYEPMGVRDLRQTHSVIEPKSRSTIVVVVGFGWKCTTDDGEHVLRSAAIAVDVGADCVCAHCIYADNSIDTNLGLTVRPIARHLLEFFESNKISVRFNDILIE
ncbi:unnamed protein product [Medioppia subpectinata]|uniref:Uncharacterized protein n=1 Tax=Medioppia subpectinata TaxID=1979941 RepID=A0A7R9PXB1_9ACAR|nr:unnamed protein product [Medioppia subpectinata]CAG2104622.1 unnamed protein product [Medioppia subpectinata]